MGNSLKSAQFLIESRLRDAMMGKGSACFELGMVFSTGSGGTDIDLIEAHKWFNLAALYGDERAAEWRTEIAEDMTAREIVEAQKAARAMIQMNQARAA